MAHSDQPELQAINQIAESLSSSERRSLLYLCDSLDTEYSPTSVKEMLKCKVLSQESGYLFLTELLSQLERFDILRKVCQTTRGEVQRTLKYQQVLPRFRVLMNHISEDMACEDVSRVKFLISNTIPREKLEKAKNFLDVVIELERLDLVSPERVDFVEECLANAGRVDLAKKVAHYKSSAAAKPAQHSAHQEMCRAPPIPNSSYALQHPLQQTRRGQSLHIVREKTPVPVHVGQSCQSPLEWYSFNSNPRGVCAIVDCVGNDGDMLEQTFKALHFNVFLFKWLDVIDTLSALRSILEKRENLTGDGLVCCIIGRGTENHLLGIDTYGPGLHLDTVRRLFTAEGCPMMAGKPKMFFIQTYSVQEPEPCASMYNRDEYLETDGYKQHAECEYIPTDADVFWSHCWTDELQLEQGQHRSIYLKALTDALLKGQKRKTKLVDTHTEVNRTIFEHNRRTPQAQYHINLKHTLRKALYLQ